MDSTTNSTSLDRAEPTTIHNEAIASDITASRAGLLIMDDTPLPPNLPHTHGPDDPAQVQHHLSDGGFNLPHLYLESSPSAQYRARIIDSSEEERSTSHAAQLVAEIKSTRSFSEESLADLDRWAQLDNNPMAQGVLEFSVLLEIRDSLLARFDDEDENENETEKSDEESEPISTDSE